MAARKAKLVRVEAMDYGDPSEPILDPLWLRFADSPWLRLCGGPSGQGFSLDEEPPREAELEDYAAVAIRDVGGEAPFAAVIDFPLEEVGLITWPIPLEDEGPAVAFPVGIRLQFEKGEVWILNVGDQTDLFAHRATLLGRP